MFENEEEFIREFKKELIESVAKPYEYCSRIEKYEVLVKLITAAAAEKRTATAGRYAKTKQKQVYYFSLEFLIGRLLDNYLINLGLEDVVKAGLKELGDDLYDICRCERDPGLGNGGLGRLAACFLDSMAFMGIAGMGMGIRYRFGLFKQKIENGCQTEEADNWLDYGYPWETKNVEEIYKVKFGGVVDRSYENGRMYFSHRDYKAVNAVAYDVPIVGYGGETVNVLRLWSAQPVKEEFDMEAFNRGDYSGASRDRAETEAISCILYPDDSTIAGKELRLKQEYFFVAAGLASIINSYKRNFGQDAWTEFPEHISIQINDTHPALVAPELLRILIDDEGLSWDEAWAITSKTVAFTNHTVLPEALEKWPIDMVKRLVPRVYMMIEEIDRRYREAFDRTKPGWQERLEDTSILWDGQVRMANLCVITSFSVNGVAALHTDIIKKTIFKDFNDITPEKFNNKTNGVSHRRVLIQANPGLTELITSAIGEGWKRDPMQLTGLDAMSTDAAFLDGLHRVKRENKCRLAEYVKQISGIILDPDSVFDIQVKRIHAYKRQLLNAFKVMDLYNQIKANPSMDITPCTFVFAGKAAQSYVFAKESIKYICTLAELVNNDPDVAGRIKVVFIENFNVSNAQLIYPAANISEQISTAGKEASGTGNMKFMFNGALTLATIDGSNVELRELVGNENFFKFGISAEVAHDLHTNGGYDPNAECSNDPRLKLITDQLVDGFFKNSDNFWNIYDSLLKYGDEYFVLKDFASYVETWNNMIKAYSDTASWNCMSVKNIAKAGYFSSDRVIAEYCDDIWHTPYVK